MYVTGDFLMNCLVWIVGIGLTIDLIKTWFKNHATK
jgi:hypothetical protein